MLSITIRDIRVNKDINEISANDPNGGQISPDNFTDPNLNVWDFRNKKVPPSIIKCAQVSLIDLVKKLLYSSNYVWNCNDFLTKKLTSEKCLNISLFYQFMSVNMQNISVVMMNNTSNPSWFLHATAGDIHLDGSTLHNLKTLVVTAALSDARVCFYHYLYRFLRFFLHREGLVIILSLCSPENFSERVFSILCEIFLVFLNILLWLPQLSGLKTDDFITFPSNLQ